MTIFTQIQQKAEGNLVVYAVALGAVILTLGQGILRLQGRELAFTADLYHSEKSHFAAESGVEEALLWLQVNPQEDLQDFTKYEDNTEQTGAKRSITIENNVKDFSFTLQPEQAKQITLIRDTDPDQLLETDPTRAQNFNDFQLETTPQSPGGDAQTPNTFELNLCLGSSQNQISSEISGGNLPINVASNREPNRGCVIQLVNQNVFLEDSTEDRSITFRFTNSGGISPHKAFISSIGKSGTREKHLQFSLERNKTLLNRNLFRQ